MDILKNADDNKSISPTDTEKKKKNHGGWNIVSNQHSKTSLKNV